MSRISYADDEEFGGQFELWQANCRRSLKGKRGQAALRELEAALVALPEKALIHGDVEYGGQVCAVGAAIKARGLLDQVADDATDEVAVDLLGWPRLVAWKIVEMNDEQLCHVSEVERYDRMLAYVRELLAEQWIMAPRRSDNVDGNGAALVSLTGEESLSESCPHETARAGRRAGPSGPGADDPCEGETGDPSPEEKSRPLRQASRIPPGPSLRPYAACWREHPDGRTSWCKGTMRPVESAGGRTIALRCSLCGFVAAGDGRLAKEVRRWLETKRR